MVRLELMGVLIGLLESDDSVIATASVFNERIYTYVLESHHRLSEREPTPQGSRKQKSQNEAGEIVLVVGREL